MNRFKTFSLFLILVAVWALFFATVKFFLWGDLSEEFQPDLQQIAGYLSLGGAIAFLIGGAFAQTFLKKYYLFIIALLSSVFILYAYLVGFSREILFAATVTILGFLYGLWNVMKSVIISIEIKKTNLPETAVTAIVGMMFVICIIFGSLLGTIAYEKIGHHGYLLLLGYLLLAGITSFFLDYDGVSFRSLLTKGWKNYLMGRKQSLAVSMKAYIPDLIYITKHYLPIIVTSSLFWSISTIISQASVEYSSATFGIKSSQATMILLYSAVGAIIGSFLSIKMGNNRWMYFMIFSILFSLSTAMIPVFGSSFGNLSIIATVLGMCFGTAVNLSDSFLLKSFGDENKKEYGASTMGLIFSIILFLSMFLSSMLLQRLGYHTVMYIFSGIILTIGVSLGIYKLKK
ncbi:MAG: hypothetical protein HHAS10_08440 [Candidatus Altimarinota bacterium]